MKAHCNWMGGGAWIYPKISWRETTTRGALLWPLLLELGLPGNI